MYVQTNASSMLLLGQSLIYIFVLLVAKLHISLATTHIPSYNGYIHHRSTTIFSKDHSSSTEYNVAFFSLTFEDKLYYNGSIPLPTKSNKGAMDEISLLGSVRLTCLDGDIMYDSFPSFDTRANPLRDHLNYVIHGHDLPVSYILPLNVMSDISYSTQLLLDALSLRVPIASNTLLLILILDVHSSKYGHAGMIAHEHLDQCEIRLLHPKERDDIHASMSIRNSFITDGSGEPIFGTFKLMEEPPSIQNNNIIFNTIINTKDNDHTVESQQSEYHKLTTSALDSTTSPRSRLKQLLVDYSGGHVDSEKMVETEKVVSLLEICSSMGSMDTLHASQYFELIEDPLMNLLVPVIVSIALQIVTEPLVKMLVAMLGPLIGDALASPIIKEMKAIQLQEQHNITISDHHHKMSDASLPWA